MPRRESVGQTSPGVPEPTGWRQHIFLYHRRRWAEGDIEEREFDPQSHTPPVTLFDVPLGSKVFEPGRGPWERVLLRRTQEK